MPPDSQYDHDVIIVGGRPAGASLAARLGAAGLDVLVLERATFPSRPAVSASLILPHTMALLDELELDEERYAEGTPPLTRIMLEFGSFFRAPFRFYEPIAGRTHIYGIDRARLDHTLWLNLRRHPSVTAVEGATVVDLLHEADTVIGVRARFPDGRRGERTARWVVGADGRFSLVARKVGAPVLHERRDVDTTIYYARWEGVAPYDESDQPLAHIHTSLDGFSVVLIPSADDQVIVVAQGQTGLYTALPGTPQQAYETILRARPAVWRRLEAARPVTRLAGYKRMGNLFRQAHGPGWALVGDAFHQKDSLDAQGIYDALWSARRLAQALIAAHAGECSDHEALAGYAEDAHAHLRPMFDSTMARVKREIYSTPPAAVAKTVMRWILTHERYGRRFAGVLTRQAAPDRLFVPSVLLPAMWSGAWRRLGSVLRSGPDPTDAL